LHDGSFWPTYFTFLTVVPAILCSFLAMIGLGEISRIGIAKCPRVIVIGSAAGGILPLWLLLREVRL
jgi:hypothetical protein